MERADSSAGGEAPIGGAYLEDGNGIGNDTSVAVVVPAYNSAETLEKVVGAAVEAAGAAAIVVVDPASTDDTSEVASRFGVRVVRLAERAGPARARNIGAARASADVIVFIDADCVLHEDAIPRIKEAFSHEPGLVGLSGSYDDQPPESNFFSQYMNLRHHLTHQIANLENATFWAGCGAVRREAFIEVGGFDEHRYPEPQIEDIELGLRLRGIGMTRLDPGLQVTHLKRWTLGSVMKTDIYSRAIPWARLILEQQEIPDDLNLRFSQRLAALVAPLALLAVPLGPAAATRVLLPETATSTGGDIAAWGVLIASVAAMGLSLILNLDLVKGFARLRGPWFALGGWLFHQVHLTYSAVTFAVCWLRRRLVRSRDRY